MTIESQNTTDANLLAPIGSSAPNFRPLDASDRTAWQSVFAQRQNDGGSVLQSLGLTDFQLSPPLNQQLADSTNPAPKAPDARETQGPAAWEEPVTGHRTQTDAPPPPANPPAATNAPPSTPPRKPSDTRTVSHPPHGDTGVQTPEFPRFVMPPRPESYVKPDIKPGVSVEAARTAVENTAANHLSAHDANQLRADIATFEGRAQKDHLSPQQIADTYQNVEQLLDAKDGPLSQAQRETLACQVMSLAADPNKAVTGNESETCGPVELETLIYRNSPEKAANLVAQVAMSQTYRSMTGTEVMPEMLPTNESNSSGAYNRLFASQIFQNTAIDTNLKQIGSNWTYHHEYGKGEANGNSEFYTDPDGHRNKFDGTTAEDLVNMFHEITGQDNLVVIRSGQGTNTENYKYVSSKEQLKSVLSDLHEHGNPPTIIGVDTRNQPFWDQQHGPAPQGNENPYDDHYHWIALKDYDSKTDTLSYHNGWDDPDHTINSAGMFRGTQYADAALPQMSSDFTRSLAHQNGNWAEAIDALRIRSETGRISDADLNNLFNRDVRQLMRQRGDSALDDSSTRKNILELRNYLNRRHALHLTPKVSRLISEWEKAHPDS